MEKLGLLLSTNVAFDALPCSTCRSACWGQVREVGQSFELAVHPHCWGIRAARISLLRFTQEELGNEANMTYRHSLPISLYHNLSHIFSDWVELIHCWPESDGELRSVAPVCLSLETGVQEKKAGLCVYLLSKQACTHSPWISGRLLPQP